MTVEAAHVFYDVHMVYQHNGLTEHLKRHARVSKLSKGEVAVFINKSWTACKVLTGDGTLLYHRNNSAGIGVETIKNPPKVFGGAPLKLSRQLEQNLLRTFRERAPEVKEAA